MWADIQIYFAKHSYFLIIWLYKRLTTIPLAVLILVLLEQFTPEF